MSQISYLKSHIYLIFLFTCFAASAQQMGTPVDSATSARVLKECATRFPKFYREFNYIKDQDKLIKNFFFVRYDKDTGPAKAGPRGNVFIDIKYLERELPGFDDNRLIVVLYHEIGHLHYFMRTPQADRVPFESEKAAFEYSLLKTKEMAEKGDCPPLKSGLKNMKLRSESNNLQDPHVVALKKLVNEAMYAEYLQYTKEKCPN